MKSVAIKCKGVKKTFGSAENKVEALKNTDLEIYNGQLTFIVGPTGSGKTTLVSIVATILKPDKGELTILGQRIEELTELEKALFRGENVGIVFQSLFLIPTLTVAENVALPLIVGGMQESEALKKAFLMLEKIHLEHRAHVSPTILSKGQQQKVAIARAMVNDAPIMICDEPTSSLDHVAGFEIMKFLQDLIKTSTKTILVVTHDQRNFKYADRIISMSDGEIVAE